MIAETEIYKMITLCDDKGRIIMPMEKEKIQEMLYELIDLQDENKRLKERNKHQFDTITKMIAYSDN